MNPEPNVPFSAEIPRIPLENRVSTGKWEQIDELFDRVLNAEDPSLIDAEPDVEVAEAVRGLWKHHLEAVDSGFLEQPATLVRNLLDRVSDASSEFVAESKAFVEGAVVGGQFTVKGLIGEGGMGQVYLAHNKALGKLVALKTIRPSLAEDPVIRGRFIGEIKSAQSVTHANVCRIYDLFEDGRTPFCSMEYLAGPTLNEFAVEPESEMARAIALQLADGLHAAHSNGIIHRDFKPQNVILVPPAEVGGHPRAVITDFGLARPVTDGEGEVSALRGAGTREYMAPELLRGEAASIRSDVFAYGKVLGSLLPSSKWVARCVAADAAARPASLAAIITDLRGEPNVSRRAILMGAAFGAVGLAGTGYSVYRSQSAPPRFPLMPTRQRMILNGLQSNTALTERALTLRQLLITGLRQSPMLGILPDERLLAVLRRLQLAAILPATLTDLFAVAKSEKAAVVVDGSVEKAARGLRMLLRVFEPGAASPAFELNRTVDDERQLVRLAQNAVTELRTEFAESEQSRRASSVPLEQVTSASPEAVDLYFRAVREYERPDVAAGLAYLDRALQLDPQFALAHLYKAQSLRGLTKGRLALESATKAFAMRLSVTERERNWIEYFYYDLCGDPERSYASIRKNTVFFPEEPHFQRFAATALCKMGRFEEAFVFSRTAVALDDAGIHNMGELVANLAEGTAAKESIEEHDRFRRLGVTHPVLENGYVIGLLLQNRFREADSALERLAGNQARSRGGTGIQMAASAVLQGKLLNTIHMIEGDLSYDEMAGEDRYRHQRLAYAAYIRLLLGRTDLALEHIRKLCAFDPLPSSIYPLRVGVTLAAENRFDTEAERALDQLKAIAARWPSTQSQGSLAHCHGVLLHCKGENEYAWRQLQTARGLWPDPLTQLSIARTASDPQEAVRATGALHALRGKTIKSYFSGLIVLGELERARNLAKLSLFEDASRSYKAVEFHWGPALHHLPLMSSVRSEWIRIEQHLKGQRKNA